LFTAPQKLAGHSDIIAGVAVGNASGWSASANDYHLGGSMIPARRIY